MSPPWRPEDDARLLAGRGAGRTWPQVAAKLGRSAAAARAREAVLAAFPDGVPEPARKRWSEADLVQLRDLVARGINGRDLAAATGRTENAIWAKLQELWLKLGMLGLRPPPSAQAVARMRAAKAAAVVPVVVPVVVPLRPSLGPTAIAYHAWGEARPGPEALRRIVGAHLAGLAPGGWSAADDLALCEGVFARGLDYAAASVVRLRAEALAWFQALTTPLRDGAEHLPLDACAVMLPALRARVGQGEVTA